jgi:hypothetical protein
VRTPPPISRSFAAHLAALLLASLLTGCATFRSYNTELNQTLSIAASGRLDAAIKTLEKNNRKDDKDLLYYLEMGELQRLHTAYARSQTAWRTADFQVQAWEDAARADPARVSGAVLSYLVNDKVRPYEGHDYEKVMLTTRMAMNHLAEGRWDNARVAIKRTHEREAVIAEVRSREERKVEEEARQRGAGVTFKDLNGYPVQTIDNPEVNGLRNSYQSAFSHYLAGFVYEALGEPSLAAAGYRQAIELRPSLPLLEDALAGLDWRVAAPDDGASDVLFVIETGLAPARVSRQFSLPIPIDERWVLVPVSFPVMQSHGAGFVPGELRVDGVEPLVPVRITSVDAMAHRALKDEMPGIMLRTFVRSFTKATAQYQAQRAASKRRKEGDDTAGAMLDLSAFALAIGSVVTESADERGWRSLPASINIARARLPRGRHRIQLDAPSGPQTVEVEVEGRYAFVSLRLVGGTLFAMLPQASLARGAPMSAPAAVPTGESPAQRPVPGEVSASPPKLVRAGSDLQFNPEEFMP